jgi:2-keto-3-deoxy-L-fuconate dehydrogenase
LGEAIQKATSKVWIASSQELLAMTAEAVTKNKKGKTLMTDRLKGKRAFVTAGAVGIGRACALAFAREGATVFATDLDEKAVALLTKDGVAETARLDVRDTAAVEAMAKKVGPVDILLNAAGFVHHGTVLECSDSDWDFSFDLNVKSMHRTIRAFMSGMLENGRGAIVNISSAAGVFKAAPNRYVYGATKAAVAALTRAVAVDFITKGVRCNAICPGTIETPSMLDRAAAAGPNGRELFVSRQPMGRLGTAEEIAALAVYLASDESAFTTGVAHIIDGGWTL